MEPGNAQLSMTVLMTPDMANFSGNVHGGTLLKYLDEVAYACASRYAGRYVVTLSVDQVIFREPVHVGELVTFLASVNYTGNTSMEVGIKVVTENIRERSVRHSNSCFHHGCRGRQSQTRQRTASGTGNPGRQASFHSGATTPPDSSGTGKALSGHQGRSLARDRLRHGCLSPRLHLKVTDAQRRTSPVGARCDPERAPVPARNCRKPAFPATLRGLPLR